MTVVLPRAGGHHRCWGQAATVSLLSTLKCYIELGTLSHTIMLCHHKENNKTLHNLVLICDTGNLVSSSPPRSLISLQ